MAMLEDVFAQVTCDWSDSKKIHTRVDLWSPVTVRGALIKLADGGLIEKQMVAKHQLETAEYRRKQAPTSAAKLTEQKLFSAIKDDLSRRSRCPKPTSPAAVLPEIGLEPTPVGPAPLTPTAPSSTQ